MITIKELYFNSKQRLKSAGVTSPDFDSLCLMKKVFNVDRQQLLLYGDNLVCSEKLLEEFESYIQKRINGEPLQYLIGEWEFYGLPFKVGRGVLIPRADTEVLVEAALDFLKDKPDAKIIDLCSGSGAVAIALSHNIKSACVWGVEISEKAYEYFLSNIELNNVNNLTAINADLKTAYKNFSDEYFDIITANPPYIEKKELPLLQKEVQYEPKIALDGGDDGLNFYRIITSLWTPKLKSKSMLAFETGDCQSSKVAQILKQNGYTDIEIDYDIQNIGRVVKGRKK